MYSEGENITEKAEKLVKDGVGLPDVPVVRAMRTPHREGRPGVVKIQVRHLEDEKKLLTSKKELKNGTNMYKKVYIRTSKSHLERLIDLNFRTLLQELPNGPAYRVTGSGRVIKVDQNRDRRNLNRNRHPAPDFNFSQDDDIN